MVKKDMNVKEILIDVESWRGKEVLSCPICRKGKVVLSNDARGRVSLQCSKCGQFFVVDQTKRKAYPSEKMRGAHKLAPNN